MKQILPVSGDILSPKGAVFMGGVRQTVSREANRHLLHNDALAQSDVGRAVHKIVQVTQYAGMFKVFTLPPESHNNIWKEFQKAIAHSATEQDGIAQSAAATFADNMKNAKPSPLTGAEFNGFYGDLAQGEHAIEADILRSSRFSPEAKLDYSKVNWNDPAAVSKYLDDVRDYSKKVNFGLSPKLSDPDVQAFNPGDAATGATELKILLHTQDQKTYGKYIHQFEDAIQKNFENELKTMRTNVANMGYKKSLTNNTELRKFAATRSPAEQAQINRLIEANEGKTNKVDRYILGRIHNGDIDINKILATGELNGVKLSAQSLAALKALNVYANADKVIAARHEDIMKNLGHDVKLKGLDLNNVKVMRERLTEMAKALDKAGLSKINGKALSAMSLKELRAIDFSKIDPKFHEGLKSFIALKEHAAPLSRIDNLKKNFRYKAFSLFRKGLGNSDVNRGIGQLDTAKRTAQAAHWVWQKTFGPKFNKMTTKLTRFMSKPIKAAYKKASNFLSKHVFNHARKAWSAAKHVVGNAPGVKQVRAATSKLSKGIKGVTDKAKEKVVNKVATRNAKKASKKLIKQAGKSKKRLLRRAAKKVRDKIMSTKLAKLISKVMDVVKKIAAKLMWYIVIILLVGLAVAAACQILGFVIDIMVESVGTIEDTWLGDCIKWFEELDFSWPWEVDKGEVQSAYLAQIRLLQDLERSRTTTAQIDGVELFYGLQLDGWDFADATKISTSNLPESTGKLGGQAFSFVSADNTSQYITQHTAIKKVVSMANVFSRPVEDIYDLANFIRYGSGLWCYFNQSTLGVKLILCDGCHSITYKCNECGQGLSDSDFFNVAQDVNMGRYFNHNGTGDWQESYIRAVFPKIQLPQNEQKHYVHDLYYELFDNKTYGDLRYWYIMKGYSRAADGSPKIVISSTDADEAGTLYAGEDATYGGCRKQAYITCSKPNCSCNGTHVIEVDMMSNTVSSNITLNQMYAPYTSCTYDKQQQCFGKHNFSTAVYYHRNGFGTYSELAKKGYIHKMFSLNDIASTAQISGTITNIYPELTYDDASNVIWDTENNAVSILVDPEVCHNCFDWEDWDWQEVSKSGNILNMYNNETRQWAWHFHTPDEVQTGHCKHYQNVSFDYKTENTTYHTAATATISPTIYYVTLNNGYGQYTGYASKEDLMKANGCDGSCAQLITCNMCHCGQYHGFFTDGNEPCSQSSPVSFYWCSGHTTTNYYSASIKLCLGHMNCVMQRHLPSTKPEELGQNTPVYNTINNEFHHSLPCNTHTLHYCTGHPFVQIVTRVIDAKSDAVYSDAWTYQSASPYGSLFGDATYSPKTAAQLKAAGLKDYTSMAHDEWQGWNDDTKAQAAIIEGGDWYALYGMKHSDFIGGTLSEKERKEILAAAAIPSGYAVVDKLYDELELNLQNAMDAVGTVPYFPNENPEDFMNDAIAIVPYPLTPSDSPQTNSSNVMLGFHGVGHQYFAAYIDCVTRAAPTTHMKFTLYDPSDLSLSVMQHNPKFSVSSTKTAPGTPIARLTGGDFKTGIYIGVTSVELEGYVQLVHLYIGMDENGWCTVQSVADENGTMPGWISLHAEGTTLKKVDTPAYSGGTSANNKNVTFTSEDFTTAAYVLFILCLAGFVIYMASKSKNKF